MRIKVAVKPPACAADPHNLPQVRFAKPPRAFRPLNAPQIPPCDPEITMKFLSRFAALSLCVLALSACGSSTSTSTAGAGDATGDGVNTADLTSVDGATPADGSADTGGPAVDAGLDENAACCAAKKATCGFVTGCKSSCGQCGTQNAMSPRTNACPNRSMRRKRSLAKLAASPRIARSRNCKSKSMLTRRV